MLVVIFKLHWAKWMNEKRKFYLMFFKSARKLRCIKVENVKSTWINITFWSFIAVINMLNCNNRAAWHEKLSSSLVVFFMLIIAWEGEIAKTTKNINNNCRFQLFSPVICTLKALFIIFCETHGEFFRN